MENIVGIIVGLGIVFVIFTAYAFLFRAFVSEEGRKFYFNRRRNRHLCFRPNPLIKK